MNILLVNTSERNGGAAVAANRLLYALLKQGVDAKMLVCSKQSDDAHVISCATGLRQKWNFICERGVIFLSNRLSRKRLFSVSIANTGYDITQLKAFQEADIVHIHWINHGMLSLKHLEAIKRSGKPVVWTMHDMWPLTGICHYAYGCERFTESCGKCPFLHSAQEKDQSNRVLLDKKELFHQWPVAIVAVSSWLASLGERSTALRGHTVSVIPNTIPLDAFKPIPKNQARNQLNVPIEKKLLVFGAAAIDSPIKGFAFLKEALNLLAKKMDPSLLHLVIYGGIKSGAAFLEDLPISYTWLGKVPEDLLPVIYSAGDVLVAPSLYETFGQTLIEAQSCGCIPVCFGNSGQTDIIEHGQTGLFASNMSAESLAEMIYQALTGMNHDDFTEKATAWVSSSFSDQRVASMYTDLYASLLSSSKA